MGGVENLPQDFANDPMMTMYMVGVSQAFIPDERRDAMRAAAEARVAELEAMRDSRAAEIARDALAARFEIASIDERLEVLDTIIVLTDSMIAAARARYEAGEAIQADVIRGQLARSDLEHRTISLRGRRAVAAAELRNLLALVPETDIPELELEATHPLAPAIDPGADTAAVAALQAVVQRAEAEIALARAAKRPEWSIEGAYAFRSEAENMISLSARIELPLRRKTRIDPRIEEAIAMRNAALARLESLRRSLAEQASVAWAVLDESARQIALHEEVLMPQARLAFDSTLAAYQTGGASFDALLGAATSYMESSTDFYAFLERALRAREDLEALAAGARTIRVAPAPGAESM
ncbi:MAG: TolC family protein, partial [Thermoanaerobaculia bacterium]